MRIRDAALEQIRGRHKVIDVPQIPLLGRWAQKVFRLANGPRLRESEEEAIAGRDLAAFGQRGGACDAPFFAAARRLGMQF